MKYKILAFILIFSAFCGAGLAQQKTEIIDKKAAKMLTGRHMLSLQWISWDYFGVARVSNRKGVYYLTGEQKSRTGSDYLKIDGIITSIRNKEFTFEGNVTTQISHIFEGKPCHRDGELTFRITGKRKYWRMQQIDNPCDQAADYVDIYFR